MTANVPITRWNRDAGMIVAESETQEQKDHEHASKIARIRVT